jgi:hypothetical protein
MSAPRGIIDLAFVVGFLNSECSQQNRANENKHGAYRQHIEHQGMVIGLDDTKHTNPDLAAERQRRPDREAVAG